jgi:hypothetical protein
MTAIPCLDIYVKECRSTCKRDTCTPILTTAIFTIAKGWNPPSCLTTDGWVKKVWYIYTMEYYSAIKKNVIMLFVGKWMELEIIMLSKVSQVQKVTY